MGTIDDIITEYDTIHKFAYKEFCLPKDFYREFLINGKKYVFNLMNLSLVDESTTEIHMLWPVVNKIIDKKYSEDGFLKELREYTSLNYFLIHNTNIGFKKSEKPDFILKNDNIQRGLEITSIIDATEAQIEKIGKIMFGRGKTIKEYEKFIREHYKRLDKSKCIIKANNHIALVSTHDYNVFKQEIISAIIKKVEKRKMYDPRLLIWVLIDTEDNSCFSSDNDTYQIKKEIDSIKDKIIGIEKIVFINRVYDVYFEYSI